MKLKKKEGSIHKFAIPLFTVVAVFIIIMVFLKSSSVIEKKFQIDVIGRDYILKMESNGYMDSVTQQRLVSDLQKVGAKNISLTGTTFNKVGYGKDIALSINCNIDMEKYTISGFFKIQKTLTPIPITVNRNSTAKH